ncbi:MAG: T9SS type A sorting domain-containing protein, partial [Bacteroidota bacterium]
SIEAGNNYEINADGSTVSNLFRNSSGATYPYALPGVVSITNTINGLGPAGFYYFFYDWVISASLCPSPPVPVSAIFQGPVDVDLGPDGTVCEGFTLDATDPEIISYVWNNDSSINTPTLTADTSGIYTVDVVNAEGCTGADTVILIVNDNPVVNLGPDATECGSYQLNAGNPGATYQWSDPDSTMQTFTATQSGTYFVNVTSLGCTASDTIELVINALPMVNLGPDYAGCLPLNLDAGADGDIYQWSTGETTQTITVMSPSTGSDTITVDVETTEGCVASDEIVISPGVAPDVDLGDDRSECDSVDIGLMASPGFTYTWSNGDTTAMISATESDQYILNVVDNVGCEASDTINVDVELTPIADATFENNNFDFTVNFMNMSNVTGSGGTYSWDFGDGGTSMLENPTYTYALAGTWPVTLIVSNSCGADTISFNLGGVSIDDDLFTQSISVYPNPTNGVFFIGSQDLTARELTIEVTDARGRRVFIEKLDNVFGGFNQPVDLTAAAEGVYTIKVSDGERTAIKRIVRE